MPRISCIAFVIGLLSATVAQAQATRPARPPAPQRDPHSPGYVTATDLPDGANAPADTDGNFIIGPTHNPASEMTANPNVPTILKLHVYIQETVKIEPEVVLWRVGEQPDPKAIHIAIADDASAKIISVTSDNPALKVKLKELKPGKEYEAQITPENVTRPAAATIMIRTDYPADNPEAKYAYARIK